ncbi:MAG: hypothetical protein NPIRA02_38910 [Nitrospirales bacterium]|nr:MAG: hypothetical protein NPIRA02_38910 [Nitrospirales bacterium]
MSSSSQVLSTKKLYRWLVPLLFIGTILLGVVFLQFTESYLQELKPSSLEPPSEALGRFSILVVFIAMAAGFPAIGIGTYMLYHGTQIQATQKYASSQSQVRDDFSRRKDARSSLKGQALMVSGGVVIIGGLSLPIVAWWLVENL